VRKALLAAAAACDVTLYSVAVAAYIMTFDNSRTVITTLGDANVALLSSAGSASSRRPVTLGHELARYFPNAVTTRPLCIN